MEIKQFHICSPELSKCHKACFQLTKRQLHVHVLLELRTGDHERRFSSRIITDAGLTSPLLSPPHHNDKELQHIWPTIDGHRVLLAV